MSLVGSNSRQQRKLFAAQRRCNWRAQCPLADVQSVRCPPHVRFRRPPYLREDGRPNRARVADGVKYWRTIAKHKRKRWQDLWDPDSFLWQLLASDFGGLDGVRLGQHQARIEQASEKLRSMVLGPHEFSIVPSE